MSVEREREREREQVFIGKQKDDLDGVAVPTPYLQQYFYTIATTHFKHIFKYCRENVRNLRFVT